MVPTGRTGAVTNPQYEQDSRAAMRDYFTQQIQPQIQPLERAQQQMYRYLEGSSIAGSFPNNQRIRAQLRIQLEAVGRRAGTIGGGDLGDQRLTQAIEAALLDARTVQHLPGAPGEAVAAARVVQGHLERMSQALNPRYVHQTVLAPLAERHSVHDDDAGS